jgi:hypothetical protein
MADTDETKTTTAAAEKVVVTGQPLEPADTRTQAEKDMDGAKTENKSLDDPALKGDGKAGLEVPANDPNKPTALLDETHAEKRDRHAASLELKVKDLTDPETQTGKGPLAEMAGSKIVPGAAAGPDVAGVVRNEHGKVAYAPPGSHDAAMNGVQEDASGHVSSVHTDNSSTSGARVYA